MSASMTDRMWVTVNVPASVANLGPGFDTLGMALALYNRYTFSLAPNGPEIEITGEGASRLPRDESHLAYRGCQAVFDRLGCSLSGLALNQVNHVPLAGGLGNSATAVVAGVLAGNALCGGKLSNDELLYLATQVEGHPDNVAPAILGGLVVAVSTDRGVLSLKLPVPEGIQVVLAVPDFTLDTCLSRRALPRQVSFSDATYNVSHTGLLVAAFCAGRTDLMAAAMGDRLHQPYRAHLVPGFDAVCQAATDAGAAGTALAGAGPSILAFALPGVDSEQIGAAMVAAFRTAGVRARYLVVEPCATGATVECSTCVPSM